MNFKDVATSAIMLPIDGITIQSQVYFTEGMGSVQTYTIGIGEDTMGVGADCLKRCLEQLDMDEWIRKAKAVG